jgi:hypothetical protein
LAEAPLLRVIKPEATPEEVAAITAAISTVLEEQRAAAARVGATVGANDPQSLDAWVRASRITARRAGLKRGPWRLSGRIGRRSRA